MYECMYVCNDCMSMYECMNVCMYVMTELSRRWHDRFCEMEISSRICKLDSARYPADFVGCNW